MKAKGLEISGTFSRRQGHMYMDMTFTNKALQHMTDFAVQFNKNRSVGLATEKVVLNRNTAAIEYCFSVELVYWTPLTSNLVYHRNWRKTGGDCY